MRNIEEIAAEEEIRSRRRNRRILRKALNGAGLGLGLWGWFIFAQGDLRTGAFWIVLSFAAFLAGWGAHRFHSFPLFAWGGALLVSVLAWTLTGLTQAPSFYWGRDPEFFLAAQSGEVTRPLWSPLSTLLAQAWSFVFRGDFFTLPFLSVVLAGLCAGTLSLGWFSLAREKSVRSFAVTLGLACAVFLSRPFWDAGTLASGTIALLGLWLLAWQRLLARSGEVRAESLGLLSGLLFSVHPAWGLLGLWNLWSRDHWEAESRPRAFLFFLLGFTPYAWVLFRTLAVFPSWGGGAPFSEWLSEAGPLVLAHFRSDWSFLGAVAGLGWAFLPLALAGALLRFLQWRKGLSTPKLDGGLWLAALVLAILFASDQAGRPGPTALWVFAGLAEGLLFLGERPYDRKSSGGLAPRVAWGILAAGALLSCLAAFLPGEACLRQGFLFPQQHALNLIRGLNPGDLLVCRDPFEADACRAARLLEPLTPGIVILDQQDLNQKWYLSQIIGKDSGILFSKINGSTQSILEDLIQANRTQRELQWAVPRLPENWAGPPAVPTLLTQGFPRAAPSPELVEEDEGRYDLSEILRAKNDSQPATRRYYLRYVEGFDNLGAWLLNQKQYSAAIRTYERALSLDPEDGVAKQSLALIYTQDNLLEAARMDFLHIVRTYPARIKQVMGEMDRVKLKNGANDAQVLALLNETVRLNSLLADAQYHLGQLYEKDGNLKAAGDMLQSAVRMNPQRVETQMALGLLMEQVGNPGQAEDAFRGVLKIDPQNKQAQAELWKLLNKP
ncbi:MAG TPA: tetratricopeptide repeat protein [bacterium]|nr:tetratricopeptide repeat protein [bacterium]